MQRRELLKTIGYSGIAGASGLHGLSFSATAKNTLVFVFLRGGADSLQMVAPVDDPDYMAARPPELRILNSGSTPGLSLPKSFSPTQDCRMHAAAAPLWNLFQSGHAQLLHACGLANATRSHFVAQDILESTVSGAHDRSSTITNGWLQAYASSRIANGSPLEKGIRYVGTNSAQMRSLQGLTSGLNISGELRNSFSLPSDAAGKSVLEAMYANPSNNPTDPVVKLGQETLQQLALLESKVPRVDGRMAAYTPPKSVSYNTENYDWLQATQTVAQLIRMDVGLQIACLDFGGWDTHEYQSGKINNLIRQWSSNLRALFDDMQAAGKNMTLVVVSEFGRRLRANASGGTDHGHAGALWLLDTQGRNLLPATQWPGLSAPQLDQGLDLQQTHDVKKILALIALNTLKT
jgi:uncharacterized protein (DUF1501 family)